MRTLGHSVDVARLTRRPIPDDDGSIAALPPATRRAIGELWRSRIEPEREVGRAFAIITARLHTEPHDVAVLRLCSRAVHDEVRHSEVCRLLAEIYLDEPVPPPLTPARTIPDYPNIAPRWRTTAQIVALACFNETLSTVFLEQCLAAAQSPLIRSLLQEHMGDDIDHARIGWAHLASAATGDEGRLVIAAHLRELAEASLATWARSIDRLPDVGEPAHGYPPRAIVRAAFREAMGSLLVPGFEHVGIDASALGGLSPPF